MAGDVLDNNLYHILASVAAFFITYHRYGFLLSGVSVAVFILLTNLWLCSHFTVNIQFSNNYRPSVSSGIFLALILPLINVGEISDSSASQELWLSFGMATIVIAQWLWLTSANNAIAWLLVCLTYGMTVFHLLFPDSLCLLGVESLVIWYGLKHIPKLLPKSFTFGELAVILQLLAHICNRSILNFFEKSWLLSEHSSLLIFIYTLLVAVILGTCVVCMISKHLTLWRFVITYTIFAGVAMLFLQMTLSENPVLWLILFVTADCGRIYLLVSWTLLLAITIMWTVNQGFILEEGKRKKDLSNIKQTGSSSNHVNETKRRAAKFTTRKMFHAFIVLVYLPGLLMDIQLLLLASVIAFAGFIIVEAARALRVPVIGQPINDVQELFVDERDQGHIFLTHIYLLVGMSVSLWISTNLLSSSKASVEMYAGVLALGVGDTVACVSGRTIGRTHWPGSKKTVEGTIFSILAQMALVMAVSFSGTVKVRDLTTAFVGVTIASLAEAFTDQIDNLVLPLVLYPVLLFS